MTDIIFSDAINHLGIRIGYLSIESDDLDKLHGTSGKTLRQIIKEKWPKADKDKLKEKGVTGID